MTARPTWWASTSAPSLSLYCSTCSTMSATGRLVTCATAGAPAGAVRSLGVPTTRTPSLPRYDANVAAADAAGSATRPGPSGFSPSSAHSAVIGADDVGEVGLRPCRRDLRAGEQRGVVGQPDPADPPLVQVPRGQSGPGSAGSRRLDEVRWSAACRPGTGRRRRPGSAAGRPTTRVAKVRSGPSAEGAPWWSGASGSRPASRVGGPRPAAAWRRGARRGRRPRR